MRPGWRRSTPARGKSLATFRLLEALYGETAVVNLLLMAANAPAAQGIRETAVGNLPDDLEPNPSAVLDAWLDPSASIDNGLAGVEVVDQGTRIRGRVSRTGTVPTWSQVEVRLATGELLYADIPTGTETESWEIEISAAPVEVRLDPDGLLPDVNRSNNRFGFGDASRIRSFFPLDEQIEVGELHFEGRREASRAQAGRELLGHPAQSHRRARSASACWSALSGSAARPHAHSAASF